MHSLTGAQVAASTGAVGDGHWTLDATTGPITATDPLDHAAEVAYDGTLAAPGITDGTGGVIVVNQTTPGSLAFGANFVSSSDTTNVTVSMVVTDGTLTLGTTAGLTFTAGTLNGSSYTGGTLTFSGTRTAVDSALNGGMTYTNNGSTTGLDPLTITVTDTNSVTTTKHDDIWVLGSASLADSQSGSHVVLKNTTGSPVYGLSVSDAGDAAALAGTGSQNGSDNVPLTVEIKTAQGGLLTVPAVTGLTESTNATTGSADITLTGSITNINTALASLKYNTGSSTFTGTDALSVSITDGGHNPTVSSSINVTVDTSPVPTVSVTSSANLALAGGTITETVTFSDTGGAGSAPGYNGFVDLFVPAALKSYVTVSLGGTSTARLATGTSGTLTYTDPLTNAPVTLSAGQVTALGLAANDWVIDVPLTAGAWTNSTPSTSFTVSIAMPASLTSLAGTNYFVGAAGGFQYGDTASHSSPGGDPNDYWQLGNEITTQSANAVTLVSGDIASVEVVAAPPVPTVLVSSSKSIAGSGATDTETVSFSNTGSATGYNGFVDLFVPAAITAGSFSITPTGSTTLGTGSNGTLTYIDPITGGTVTLSAAQVTAFGLATGDEVIGVQLPAGAWTSSTTSASFTFTVTLPGSLAAGTNYHIGAAGGFQYGDAASLHGDPNDWWQLGTETTTSTNAVTLGSGDITGAALVQAVPNVSISSDASVVMPGSTITETYTFSNIGASNGYNSFVDLFVPTAIATNCTVTVASQTTDGTGITSSTPKALTVSGGTISYTDPITGGTVTLSAGQVSALGLTSGGEVIGVSIPVGTWTPSTPSQSFTVGIKMPSTELAVASMLGNTYYIGAAGGFQLAISFSSTRDPGDLWQLGNQVATSGGGNAVTLDNSANESSHPTSTATGYDIASTQAGVKLLDVTVSLNTNGGEDESATGPDFTETYVVDIVPAQFSDGGSTIKGVGGTGLQVSFTLPNSVVYTGHTDNVTAGGTPTVVFTGSGLANPSGDTDLAGHAASGVTSPGGTITISLPNGITLPQGGSGEVKEYVTVYVPQYAADGTAAGVEILGGSNPSAGTDGFSVGSTSTDGVTSAATAVIGGLTIPPPTSRPVIGLGTGSDTDLIWSYGTTDLSNTANAVTMTVNNTSFVARAIAVEEGTSYNYNGIYPGDPSIILTTKFEVSDYYVLTSPVFTTTIADGLTALNGGNATLSVGNATLTATDTTSTHTGDSTITYTGMPGSFAAGATGTITYTASVNYNWVTQHAATYIKENDSLNIYDASGTSDATGNISTTTGDAGSATSLGLSSRRRRRRADLRCRICPDFRFGHFRQHRHSGDGVGRHQRQRLGAGWLDRFWPSSTSTAIRSPVPGRPFR